MKTIPSPIIKQMLLTVALTLITSNAPALTYTVLKHFTGSDGYYPSGNLLLSGSTFYGTTSYGGSSDRGTVFKVNTDGSGYTVLKHFTVSDGHYPYDGLVLDGSTLYGVTRGGGSTDVGTVFKLNTDGSGYTVLKDFTGSVGKYPSGRLVLGGSTLYGVTDQGGYGSTNLGTVFKVNTDGSGYTVLKDFTGSDGKYPYGGLVLDGSTLYGVTSQGGYGSSTGTVFKVNTDGSGYTVLKDFNGSDGKYPHGGLVLDGSTLYGAA